MAKLLFILSLFTILFFNVTTAFQMSASPFSGKRNYPSEYDWLKDLKEVKKGPWRLLPHKFLREIKSADDKEVVRLTNELVKESKNKKDALISRRKIKAEAKEVTSLMMNDNNMSKENSLNDEKRDSLKRGTNEKKNSEEKMKASQQSLNNKRDTVPWSAFNFHTKNKKESPSWSRVRLPFWNKSVKKDNDLPMSMMIKKSLKEKESTNEELPMSMMSKKSAEDKNMPMRFMLSKKEIDICKRAIKVCSNVKRSTEDALIERISEKLTKKLTQ